MAQQVSGLLCGEWLCASPGTVASTSFHSLSSLFQSIPFTCLRGDPATCFVKTLTIDSRNCTENTVFLALCGEEHDGHDYIQQALGKGCTAVLVEKARLSQEEISACNACIIEVADSRQVYTLLAEQLFAFPAQEMTMMGITGTNGKTSISYLLESILRAAGKQPGVIGTVNYRYMDACGKTHTVPSPFTTPEPFLLQGILREMADNGVDHVIMEVSSHGLAQNRIGQVLFDVAAFTNLSRDHLDFHQDMDSYFQAKSILFRKHLKEGARVVLNFSEENSHWSQLLYELCKAENRKSIRCGTETSDIFVKSQKGTLQSTEIVLQTDEGPCSIVSPLVGDFNMQNLQVSYAMARAIGLPQKVICEALQTATGAPGRMQRIQVIEGEESFRPSVFVDYAHTPDALLQVLKTLKTLPHNELFCVFGCGGNRDTGKRSLMGEITGKYADVAIITDDNPRMEDPALIRSMVVEGSRKTKLSERDMSWLQTRETADAGFVQIPDRHTAIKAAIEAAGGGDIVLIAGKGHEDYQITQEGKRFFDDSLEAVTALSGWTLESLALATNGELIPRGVKNAALGVVSTDSRTVCENDIFVALKGERFDAHDYAHDVASAGAGCLILHRLPDATISSPVLLVEDTEKALGKIAAYRRKAIKSISNPVLVGITGSSGKTTLKEMCYSVFIEQWPACDTVTGARVLKTEGNFNNAIGLPLSLLPLTPAHRGVLLEMGMNSPGEIAYLTEIVDPDIACIVNVHGAHLQGLGTIEGVARAKGELFRNCKPETILVVNTDDKRVVALAAECKQQKIFFGSDLALRDSLDVYPSAIDLSQSEEIHFTLHIGQEETRIKLPVPGVHNISNALAAAAISHAAGISLEQIGKGLGRFTPADSRMQIIDGPSGSRIINDCYNANPQSMRAGIATLAEFKGAARVAVLGDMLELGENAEQLHREIGFYAGERGIEFLAVLGEFKDQVQAGVNDSDGRQTTVKTFTDQSSCYTWLKSLIADNSIHAGTYILVKGSRGMHLENLVKQLQGGRSE